MKKAITTLQDALAFQLQGLYYAETKMKEEFTTCSRQLTSAKLKTEITKYVDSAESKQLKLERVFNYLSCTKSVSFLSALKSGV
jgi:ferritin-like metal-binding protein YciE